MIKITKYDEKLTFATRLCGPPHRRLKTMATTANGPCDVTASVSDCLQTITKCKIYLGGEIDISAL